MRRLLRFVATLALAAALPSAASADSSKELRLRDLVHVADGKMKYEDLALCQFHFPDTTTPKIQILSQAEAPSSGVISRDNFVALVTQQEILLGLAITQGRPGLTPVAAVQAMECEPLGKATGKPDMEMQITITKDGMRLVVTDTATGRKSASVSAWEEPAAK